MSHKKSGTRSPSIRARFVRRAEYLQGHRPFWRAMEHAVADWNEGRPAFAIIHRGFPPEQPCAPGEEFPCPAAIRRAMAVSFRRIRASGITAIDWAANDASIAWSLLVNELCVTWWPVEFFPNWLEVQGLHPAQRFVAACLLWDPKQVPADWIAESPLRPLAVRRDPRDPARQPDVVFWRTVAGGLIDRLRETTQHGAAVTPQALEGAIDAAVEEGRTAKSRVAWGPERAAYYFVPLFRGITASDWRDLGEIVVEHDDADERRLIDQVRDLKRTMSIYAIANLLGVPRNRVSAWVDDP